MKTIRVRISEIDIVLLAPYTILPTKAFEPFLLCSDRDEAQVTYQILLQEESSKPSVCFPETLNQGVWKVIEGHKQVKAFYDLLHHNRRYGWGSYNWDHKIICLYYRKPKDTYFFSELPNTFFHIGFETLLHQENRFIIHSHFLEWRGHGIMFSGPSGIGKSTQGALWEKYTDSTSVNGDRTIVAFQEKRVWGWGSPYAGSSEIYRDIKAPVSVFIVLKQGPIPSVRPLSGWRAYTAVYSALTVPSDDMEFTQDAITFAQQFVESVPVLEFSATQSEESCRFLQDYLLKNNWFVEQKT